MPRALPAVHSLVHVAPGDSGTYNVPINRPLANNARTLVQGEKLQLGVEVHPWRYENNPDGTELDIAVGATLHSENKLAWPPN